MRAVALACFVLVASPAWSQTVVRTIDLMSLGFGIVEAAQVEIDGDFSTEEWAIKKVDVAPAAWRVVTIRNNTPCVGPWFTPTTSLWPPEHVEIVRDGLIHRLKIGGWPRITIVAFDVPDCSMAQDTSIAMRK